MIDGSRHVPPLLQFGLKRWRQSPGHGARGRSTDGSNPCAQRSEAFPPSYQARGRTVSDVQTILYDDVVVATERIGCRVAPP
jgi:hypothetical protein